MDGNPNVPTKCPKCHKPAVKQIMVRVPIAPASVVFVPKKGTIKYECGAQYRWEHRGLETVTTIEPCKPQFATVAA